MLPKENRLSKKNDFQTVKEKGRYITSKLFTVSYLKKQETTLPRFGFIVSKKISTKAHERNKVKRILRETIQKNMTQMKEGFDFVILAKSGILHASNDTIETELKNAIKNI